MKIRALSVLVLAVLVAAGLTACRTNVGVAASYNGHEITDSDVAAYLTADAKPVQVQGQSGPYQAAPRSYVLETLIDERLFEQILSAGPIAPPTKGALAQLEAQTLGGKSPAQFARHEGVRGYTDAFARIYARVRTMVAALVVEQNNKVDLRPAIKQVQRQTTVSVSPRYGKWDPASLSLLSPDPTSGLPGYLHLQPTAAAGSMPQPLR